MTKLNTSPNLENADDFYANLLDLHDDLSPAQSDALNARLILILANHIGDSQVLKAAFKAAALDTK